MRRYGANDGYLKVVGLQTWKVQRNGEQFVVDFVVVDKPGQPSILGLPSCRSLDLVRRVHSIEFQPKTVLPPIVKEFQDVFTGLGQLPVTHDNKLKTGESQVEPVISAASWLPFKLEERVNAKLDQMVKEGIITQVKEPTEWVSRMMVVGKSDGDVRICMDPSALNKAIQRPHFTVPTPEQLFSRVGKARFFCTLDAASGFYQIPLSPKSSKLCTMATPRGRYRFLRMPFGICSAPEMYIQTMQELFGDLPGLEIYFDDFLVHGETKEDLHANLRRVLERCRLHNLEVSFFPARSAVAGACRDRGGA